MLWKRAVLPEYQVEPGALTRVQEAFIALFGRAGTPRDMALYMRDVDGLPGGVAEVYAAVPSDLYLPAGLVWSDSAPPPRVGTSLLAGHHDALDQLR